MIKMMLIAGSLLIISFSNTFAKEVDPEFSGEWYEEANLESIDNCMTSHWSYKNKTSNKNALLNKLFTDHPPQNNCQWQYPFYEGNA